MALTLKRFVAIVVLGMAAVLALAVGAVAGFHEFRDDAGSQSVRRVRTRISDLNGAIVALTRRDSIAIALRARPAAPGLTIVLPTGGTAAQRDSVSRIIRNEWTRLAGDGRAYPVVVLVRSNRSASGDARFASAEAYDVTLIPEPPGLNACVIDIYAPLDLSRQSAGGYIGTSFLSRLPVRMPPCAVIARYGAPGPGVLRWLNTTSWRAASNPVPVAAISSAPRDRSNVRGQPRSTGMFVTAAAFTSAWFSGVAESRTFVGMQGVECLADRTEACAAMLRADERGEFTVRGAALFPPGVVRRSPFRSDAWNRTLLASIERSLGPEKFAQFWKSSDEPEAALEKVVSGGAAAIVRDRLTESAAPLSSNPWPTAIEWLTHLALIGAAGALMSLGARARTMKVS